MLRSIGKIARLASLGFVLAGTPAAWPQGAATAGDCDAALGLLPAFHELGDIYSSILARPSLHCTHATQNSCAEPALDTHWHMQAVDGDLMQKEMDAWRAAGKSGGREGIAIVDGLFGPDLAGLLQKPPASAEARTKFGADRSGHGSQTAQFVGGKEGLGLAPQNPLYLYDVAFDEGTVETSEADKAVLDACNRGNRIINVSLNVNKRAANTADALSALVVKLAQNGCVLVKAAGNNGVQDASLMAPYEQDFQLYLSAGATRRSGGVAGFSDLGSVYAPGQGLAVFLPPSQLLTCGVPKVEAILGGTSFAAPIIAGIASQVLEVMMTSVKFRSLSPLEQTRTLVRVVKDSALTPTGNVNGLRAVRGAMDWVAKAGGAPAPAIPKSCGTIPPACVSAAARDCSGEKACSEAFRTALSLCPEKLGPKALEVFLGASSVDPWLGLRAVDTLASVKNASAMPALRKLIAQSYDEDYWKRSLAQQKPPFTELDNFVDLYARLRVGAGIKPTETDGRVLDFLLRLQGDSGADKRRVAYSAVGQLIQRPEAGEALRSAARRAVVEKHSLFGPVAVDLVTRLNDAQGGSPGMDAFAMDLAKNFPESERPLLLDYLRALTLSRKRLGNTSQVLDAIWPHAKKLGIKEKIGLRNYLTELGDRGRLSDEEKARYAGEL